MCAIFGWIKNKGSHLTKEEILCARKALTTMVHRGPDSQGEWYSNNVYMGHRRLKIIDLSEEANQPFIDEKGRYIVTFNGEIYNYLELRPQIEKENFKFRTASDTEVLLASFMLWGKGAFLKFDGMFAAAIHDTISEKNYLFRDHLGQKPLYYYVYDEGIVYASELRALLALECFKWQIDLNNFLKFLTNSYYIWDTTPLIGVKKLLPGCYLEIEEGRVSLQRYWDSIPDNNLLNISFEDASLEFQRLFDRSCEISMRSDVPYGVFLSGGIDSSLVLDSCHKFNQEISSFSVSMAESDFDEWGKAKIVADQLKIKTRKAYLMNYKSIQESIDVFFGFLDEPHGDPGFVNSYFLAKSCRSDITVAIAGDGADELFAGYVSFLALEKERFFNSIPAFFVSGVNKLVKHLLPGNDKYLGLQFRALSLLQGFPAHETTRFPLWLGAISPEELQMLCPWQDSGFFSRKGEEGTLFEDFRRVLSVMEGRSRTQMFLYFYQKFFLPEFVCLHTDRAAMQNSLEVRSPFLSVSLVEFANKLPDYFKTSNGELKKILKYVAYQRGFQKMIYNQKKQGFTFPIARWLKTVLRSKMDEILSSKIWNNGLINPLYMEHLKEEHLLGKRNNYRILFNLMVFGKWLEKFPQVSVGL